MAVRPEDRVEIATRRKVAWKYQQDDRFLLNVHRRDRPGQTFAIPEGGVGVRPVFKRLDEVRERLRCRRSLEFLEVRVGLSGWSPFGGREGFAREQRRQDLVTAGRTLERDPRKRLAIPFLFHAPPTWRNETNSDELAARAGGMRRRRRRAERSARERSQHHHERAPPEAVHRLDCHDEPRGRRLVPVAERPRFLTDLLQLLEGVAIRRDEPCFSGDGPDNLGDAEVVVRANSDAMRRADAPGRARTRAAQPCDQRSVRVEHADAARQIALDRPMAERALTRAPPE